VTSICRLVVADADAGRLSTLLASLPALEAIGKLGRSYGLNLRPHPGAAVAAAQDSLAGAARAIARCSCLRRLDLRIELADKPVDRVSAAFWQYLAEARALEHLKVSILAGVADMHSGLATASASQLITGLAGLTRLRALALKLDIACEEATLPACVSCLVQLTSLGLFGLRGLRCAPGWARLPALESLLINQCVFAADGEDALPGMDALASLTILVIEGCPGLRVLPASLWRLARLRCLTHWAPYDEALHDELSGQALPASAPCFPFLLTVALPGCKLRDWPACVLAMTRLTLLDLSGSCFEQLPEGLSVLTALEALRLGRHPMGYMQIGGALDARALGSLAGFPALRELSFTGCSVLFCPSFEDAAAHPRLGRLHLDTSYPACGPSCQAFLGCVIALLRQGRADVLRVQNSDVQGAGQQDGQSFRGALRAVGFAVDDDDGGGDGDGVALCDDDSDGDGVLTEDEDAGDAE